MPATETRAPIGVVCDDRANARHAVGRLLVRCGFDVGATAEGFASLRESVRTLQPAVAVVSLPLPGMNSLRAVHLLREDAPHCQIVLLSDFAQLNLAAVEAGAVALVPEDDLPALQRVLRGIADAARPHPVVTLPDPRSQAIVPATEGFSRAPTVA